MLLGFWNTFLFISTVDLSSRGRHTLGEGKVNLPLAAKVDGRNSLNMALIISS